MRNLTNQVVHLYGSMRQVWDLTMYLSCEQVQAKGVVGAGTPSSLLGVDHYVAPAASYPIPTCAKTVVVVLCNSEFHGGSYRGPKKKKIYRR